MAGVKMYTSASPTELRHATCARAFGLNLTSSAGLMVSDPPQPASSPSIISAARARIEMRIIGSDPSRLLGAAQAVQLDLHDVAVGALLRQLVQRFLVCC